MRVAYFDCIAGISGDTALAALIDLGVDPDALRQHLSSLPLGPFELEVTEVEEHGIRATRVDVRTSAAGVIRTYGSVRAVLDGADLPEEALRLAQRILRRLAQAEARVHRRGLETVTFPAAAGVDAVVAVVGAALGLSMLGIGRVFSSAVPTGLGMARTEHGAMPIPSPTVLELLRGAPLFSRGVAAELTTATGAALLAAIAEGYGEMPAMRLEGVGYGAGKQALDFPNLLRVLVGQEASPAALPGGPGEPELRLVGGSSELPTGEDAG